MTNSCDTQTSVRRKMGKGADTVQKTKNKNAHLQISGRISRKYSFSDSN